VLKVGMAIAGIVVAVSFSTAAAPQPASACSRMGISAEYIPDTVAKSPVVAIGTFVEASERVGIFRIDEAIKGPAAGSMLEIDNRTAYTGSACSPYDEPFGEGFRFRPGDERLLILEKEVDGAWQVAFYSDTAWPAPEDELQPLIQDLWVEQTPMPSLASVRAEIEPAESLLGTDLAFEKRTPCNVVPEVSTRVASSTAVVIAEIQPGTEFATARVVEVLAGDAEGDSFTLNHRTRRDYEDCDVVLDEPRPQGYLDGRYLLYLRPDEFGIADYRPTFWGYAMEEVNERYVTHGLPTLSDIRLAVGQQPATAPADLGPPAAEGAAWPPGVFVAVCLGLGAAAWVIVTRRRGAGGS